MRMRSELALGLLLGLAVLLCGCAILNSRPVARFEVTPVVIYAGETVTFDASSSYSGQSIVSYTWEFEDGEVASGREASHIYTEPGRYRVTLHVKDAGGRNAWVSDEILVYLRSGSQIFFEDFSSGTQALAEWELDPAWASTTEGKIENLSGVHGFVLHIDSGMDRWHRRTTAVKVPPLRFGQWLVISCQVMTSHTQDAHTFFIFPGRKSLDSLAGSLPYFVYTSAGEGAYLREPDKYGGDVGHPLSFKPGVYLWYTYKFVFSSEGHRFYVNDVCYASGAIFESFTDSSDWLILLGDESHAEACNAYFDNIRMWIEE